MGEYGGWLLGPNAGPAAGMADLNYTEALLNHLEKPTASIRPGSLPQDKVGEGT